MMLYQKNYTMIKSPVESGKNPHIPIMVKEVIQYLKFPKMALT